MSLKVFAVLAVLAFSAAHGMKLKLKKPDVTYCKDGSDQWFANIQVDVQPWPVHIAAGASLSLDGGVDILQTVEDGSRVALEMELKTVLGPLKIPCLEIEDLHIGSCEYEVSYLLSKAEELGICDLIMAEGQSCAMPLNPGSYAPGNDALEVTIPDIPAILEPFLKGDISVKAQGFDPSGAEVACLALTIELS